MKILVAEDDPVSLKVLELTLHNMGHETVLASNGAAAWKAFDHYPARVVVSDWMMPEMDGLELCKKIRSRSQTDYTYFILLTARTEKENYYEAMQQGVDDFLTKPMEKDELAIRLRVADRILSFATQIRQLKQLLPICMYCKKIRDDKDYWQQVDAYIHTHTGTDFSHSICPSCYDKEIQPQLKKISQKIKIKKTS